MTRELEGRNRGARTLYAVEEGAKSPAGVEKNRRDCPVGYSKSNMNIPWAGQPGPRRDKNIMCSDCLGLYFPWSLSDYLDPSDSRLGTAGMRTSAQNPRNRIRQQKEVHFPDARATFPATPVMHGVAEVIPADGFRPLAIFLSSGAHASR